jgi:hypothetical protein
MTARLAALDFIAGCLEVLGPSDRDDRLRDIITSGRLDWRMVIEVADMQRVTSALWVALRNRKLTEYLPSRARRYFWKIHLLNTRRNLRLREQALEAVAQLNSIGIEPLLLKGAVSLFVETYDDPGARIMTDLDILVPQKDAEDCWRTLLTLGYMPLENNFDYPRLHHLRPLYRPGEYGTIELHGEVLLKSLAHILPASQMWKHREHIEIEGVVMGIPAPTHRVLHNLSHAALMDRKYAAGEVSLKSLHELALMQTLYGQRIDWNVIWHLMHRSGKSRSLDAWLYLAHRWLGSSLPEGMGKTLGTRAYYVRTRLQARWSWTKEIVDRCMWFSARNIRERYQADGNSVSLMKGRARLAGYLSRKYCSRALQWTWRKTGSLKVSGWH